MLTYTSREILFRKQHEESGYWDHANAMSGAGGDCAADHHSFRIMLLTCRQHVCAPQWDRDLREGMGMGTLFTAS